MYQGLAYLLWGYMSDPLVNRNDEQYSSAMETTMDTITGWRHEDGTPCHTPEDCSQVQYLQFWGGRPDFGSTLAE